MKKLMMVGWVSLLMVVKIKSWGYEYEVIDLGASYGNNTSSARGINNKSEIVGDINSHAFIYTNGAIGELGTLGGSFSFAYAINDNSQITGNAFLSGNFHAHAFRYISNSMEDLGTLPGGNYSFGYGINISAHVVGSASFNEAGDQHAFLCSTGEMQDIGTLGGNTSYAFGINSNGRIIGYSKTTNNVADHAFLYSNSLMQDLGTLGGVNSHAWGINDKGQIVGDSSISNTVHAFISSNGTMKDLGTLANIQSPGYVSFAYGINIHGQVVGISTTTESFDRAFLYSDGLIQDLNNLIDPASGWTLLSAYSINDVGQIVGYGLNAMSDQHAFLLNPMSLTKIKEEKLHPPYGNCITKDPNKDSLIIVTHGWINPLETATTSTAWVDDMTNAICMYLSNHGITNWQVADYKWIEGAQTGWNADLALSNGKQEGQNLGQCLELQGWTHYHFITHSAGSGLIEECAKTVGRLFPGTVIHCTFLDPFLGSDSAGKASYGAHANWSDSYFSRDIETGGEASQFTQGPLDHAYTVDVTDLDVTKTVLKSFIYETFNGSCLLDVSSHGWPIDFYMNTIRGDTTTDYAGFGFRLSEEAGNWNFALSSYGTPNTEPRVLGSQGFFCYASSLLTAPVVHRLEYVDFLGYAVIQSTTGVIEKFMHGVRQTTDSPAWSATFVSTSNAVNTVSFDSWFESTPGAQGVLKVYWETNVIGFINEALAPTNMQHYAFKFPRAEGNSLHMLGFRLDPYSMTPSTVMITNIALGYSGVSQSFTLSPTTNTADGSLIFNMLGEAGFNYTLEASTNLHNWDPIAILINTNGIVPFVDSDATNFNQRFYRVIAPN